VDQFAEEAEECLRREGRSPSRREQGGITKATNHAMLQIAGERRVA
jgi:hypothetical protein